MNDDHFDDSLEPLDELEPVESADTPPAPAPAPAAGMPQPTFLVLPPYPIHGGVFKQLFMFFYSALACFIGALLPFGHLDGAPGYTAVSGALALFFSLLLMLSMLMSMYTRRLSLGFVLLMFIPAVWANWKLVVKMKELEGFMADPEATEGLKWFEFFFKLEYHEVLWGQMGSGMLFVWAGSTLVALGFLFSVFGALLGGGGDSKAKPAGKSARGGSRGRRR